MQQLRVEGLESKQRVEGAATPDKRAIASCATAGVGFVRAHCGGVLVSPPGRVDVACLREAGGYHRTPAPYGPADGVVELAHDWLIHLARAAAAAVCFCFCG